MLICIFLTNSYRYKAATERWPTQRAHRSETCPARKLENMHIRSHGFTLLELMTYLGILSLLISIGIPELNNMIYEQKLRKATQDLFLSAAIARSEAVKRNLPVLVMTNADSWSNGWKVFVDHNNDGTRNQNEPVIAITEKLDEILARGNTPVTSYIRFTPSGRPKLIGGGFQAGTITLCTASSKAVTRRLIMNASGRIRIKKSTTTACNA